MTIIAKNIDSKFWDIEYIAVDILKSIEKTGKATIHFNTEGLAFTETNLYWLFEYLKNKYSVDLSKITIITGNILEDLSKEYNVKICPAWMYELREIQKLSITPNKNKNAKTFGLLVGRSNCPRLMIAGHLFSNYNDDTFLTFHYDSSSDYHKNLLGLEDLMHRFGTNSDIVSNSWNLLKSSPIKKDEVTYPIIQPECYKVINWYNNFYIDIVCETYFTGDVFFPTEKIWRAIVSKTPFIVQGPRHFLKRIREIGFRTFEPWWDESYDDDTGNYKLTSILRVIDQISCYKSIDKMYNEMSEILEHNHNHFYTMTTDKIQQLLTK